MFPRFSFFIPSLFFIISGFLAGVFFALKKEQKQISVKVFVIYSLVTLLSYALIGLSGLMKIENPLKLFIALQVGSTLLGIIHAFTLYRLNAWNDRDSFVHELVFTLYVSALAALSFIVVFSLCNQMGYVLIFSGSIIFFLVPFLVLKCYEFMIQIPEEVYTKWFYPIGQGENDLPEELLDDTNVVIIEFRMLQNTNEDSELIKSRSRLPLKIEFSKFFPAFLEQFNDRNPGRKIQFMDANNEPHGWNFYLLPKWWQFKTYINPQLTIRENGIKENSIIIAERV